MKDPNQLKSLVLEKVDLAELLLGYGVRFTYDPRGVEEVQFQCPFHGVDKKPSARLYRSTQTCYCWFCGKRWDVISFIMDREKLHFLEALKFLIKKFNIDISGIPDEPEIVRTEKPSISEQDVELKRTEMNIRLLKGKIEFTKYRALVSAWYMISWQASRGLDVIETLHKLGAKIKGLSS